MDQTQYQAIKTKVLSVLGINLDSYKDEQMRRRLDSWLARSGMPNWESYFVKIKENPAELEKFRDYLTINVTEFFRDPERWIYLRHHILPVLLDEKNTSGSIPGEGLKIWSAGCSTGAEASTLTIILDELTPGKKHNIIATDLDRGALAKAKAGGPYAAEEVRNVSPLQKSTYFKPGGPPFYVAQNIINRITFREQNLIMDSFSPNFDLIVCRNVVIYFTAETKQLLYQKFYDALRPGGVLFVGGTEIIPKPQEYGFKSKGFSFYFKS
jgi:chemotaxis protein methyltransferase CheR